MAHGPGPDRWFFDAWSRFYEAPLVQRVTYRPPQDAVLRELRSSAPGPVLDIGCGTGLLTARIREDREPELTVGCDFSRGMLQQASRKGAGPWIQGDATRLPFRDQSFAAVVSTEAFHWFPDQQAALAEFFRVLAPDGRLLLALVNPASQALSRATRLGSRIMGEPLRWPTRSRLRRQVEAAGFRVDDQRSVLRLPASLLLPCVLTTATRRG